MDTSNDITATVGKLIDNISNEINIDVPINTSQEPTVPIINENHQNLQTSNEPVLVQISEINTNITFLWRIHAFVTFEYPKRIFMNTHGNGEISSWDLTDQSGSITLVAFNLNSLTMTDKLQMNKAYEFTNLSIRGSLDAYKTLPHPFQLTCSNATRVHEINVLFNIPQLSYNFTHLNQVATIPLNSMIDVQVRVLRDFGISTGMNNENIWTRRDIHVDQDGVRLGMTLWNNQARFVDRSMANLRIKFKNVKVSWFDGSRVLITVGNTHLKVMRN